MGLFSKKKKYDIDEKENIPQFVYGIPDNLRKQWEDEYKKIDSNCIFEAFEGRYFGPSYYYFINENNDKYYFRFGYANDGRMIFNSHNNKDIKEIQQNKDHYNKMINEINNIVKNWEHNYNNNEIIDGTQWYLNIKSASKKYSGLNAFPSNYYDLVNTLKKYFNVDPSINDEYNYELNPENNVPREVYGNPNFIRQQKNNKTNYDIELENNVSQRGYGVHNPKIIDKENEIISVNININNYSLYIIKLVESANLIYRDNNKTSYLADVIIIPITKFDNFLARFNSIICDWNNNYEGNKNIKWSINITYENSKKDIVGNGELPKLWNKFIELISEYEILYKKLVISKIKEKSNAEKAKEALKEIESEVDNILIDNGLMNIIDGKNVPVFGSCHTRWEIEKKILKERYNIDWKKPDEENPFVIFD